MAHHHHVRTTFIYVVSSLAFFATFYNHSLRHDILSPPPTLTPNNLIKLNVSTNNLVQQNVSTNNLVERNISTNNLVEQNVSSIIIPNKPPPFVIPTTSVLIPNWEILVLIPYETTNNSFVNYTCLFDSNEVSLANFSGVLPFPDRSIYSCFLPTRARRKVPFKQPVLVRLGEENNVSVNWTWPSLLRWNYMAYDSLTTEKDVFLFVKGVNTRQGVNRKPEEFNCVFGDDGDIGDDAVRTSVTSSVQEVFRCDRPENVVNDVKVSLEVINEERVVPSLAIYEPVPRKLDTGKGKALICATTMVYNVAKYLKEWVLYHSRIGVDKFLLYDNESDDDLVKVVEELVKEGYDITTYFWLWPKTQEGGFSHSAIYARDACKWMMYIDVDEFVYSPSWDGNVTQPSKSLLHSLIAKKRSKYGQFSIGCHEFGPSGQKVHPEMGVTQGYNCRRKFENRHKSIVLLDAVDDSLLNVIHHFTLKPGYKTRKLNATVMVVNHYKYQAWPEFKAKFRRRVSAYVLDWTQRSNPNSNDRTPGLGYSAIEPPGWANKFCEIHDNRLRNLVLKWFGTKSDSGYQLAWQR